MAHVTGSRTRRKYTMTVGDKGRTFRGDDGQEMDEKTFRSQEDDYTQDAGNTAFDNKDRSGYSRATSQEDSGHVETNAAKAPVVRDSAPSLGDYAKKRKLTAADAGRALAGRK